MSKITAKKVINRKYVGINGDYKTVKEAVDWFNSSANTDIEILCDSGDHEFSDTVIVNNSSYDLQIRGLGCGITRFKAVTGLLNKPMFNFKSNCDLNKITATGSTLSTYGTHTGEDFIIFDTTPGIYSEIKDIFFDTFYKGFNDIIGVDIFFFDFSITTCKTGVSINHTGTGKLDIEIGNVIDCDVGLDLIKASTKQDINLNGIILLNSSGDIGIQYAGAAVVYDEFKISNITWNYVGTFGTGFDFSRIDGRDANIYIKSCIGIEDKSPHAKLNITDNATTTTLTTQNLYYKIADMNSKTTIVFDQAATAGNFTISIGGQTTGNIAYNADTATIKTAVEALSTVTDCTVTQIVAAKEWTIVFNTATEGWTSDHSVNVSGLSTTTSAVVTQNFYSCKVKFDKNKMINLSKYPYDAVIWITGNVSASNNNRNINIAVKKNNTTILSPFTVRATTASQAYPFAIPIYLDGVAENDYFEVFAANLSAAGETITVQDIYIYYSSR
jgi:hypothetical protein